MKTFIKFHYQKIKSFYKKYERVLVPATLIGGFFMEYIKFIHIPINATFVLLFVYWFVVGAIIIFTHTYDAGNIPKKFRYLRLFSPLIIQFSFGALLGASLIFYWLAGDFSISWPIMIVLVLLMVFNETFRHYFDKPLVQLGVYFFVTFSLFSELLPYVFSSLSEWMFIWAGALSLIIFLVYIYCLGVFAPQLKTHKQRFYISIVVITIIMNVLYFTNIIPPIPLALREAGLYHSLTISKGQYIMKGESQNLGQALWSAIFGETVHVALGERVYLYSTIFAPDNLDATIIHHWQYYDPAQKKWIDKGNKSDLSFIINGGRKEGYKGYSYQVNLALGKWRVYVENQRGQVLGRVRFTVEGVDVPVLLQEIVR